VSEFIVSKVGPHWVVVNNGVIFSRHANEAGAVAAATGSAAYAATVDGPKRVILERENGPREVIWNSEEHAGTRHGGSPPS
jgi:hypothetical protein